MPFIRCVYCIVYPIVLVDGCDPQLLIDIDMCVVLVFGQGSEPNERTHLLPNPVNNSPTVIANNGDFMRENQNTLPQKNELNALNRIVQDFAT